MRMTWSLAIRALGGVVTAFGAVGCTEPVGSIGDAESSGGSTSTSSTLDAGTGAPTTGLADGSTGVGFVPPDDFGRGSLECDVLLQDCPAGEKCTSYSNDGGGAWNATRCWPIAEDPVAVDEPCHVEGSGTSGIDDCERGAMCWDVDPKTNEGVCVAYCVGSDFEPYCEDPYEMCDVGPDSVVALCLPLCDPIEQSCPAGEGCYPVQDSWVCAPDASGEQGAYGDACEFIDVCDPGLICLDASTVPPGLPCEGAGGCCTEICDIAAPLGDLQCTGAAEGQTCQPWYEEGSAPAVLEGVGACALPQ